MIFANKTGTNQHGRSRTPQKNIPSNSSTARGRKQALKYESSQRDKSKAKQPSGVKYKTKDSFQILQCLEDIYSELSFNEYDVFPLQNIEKAKKNIEDLVKYLGDQPTCRHHKDLLNLYCDSDKSVICVSCVYKAGEHKGHKIKPLEHVEKALQLETIRHEERTRSLVHQLNQLKDQIDFMTKQIQENYMLISKYTINIIDESIKELNAMRGGMEKKLSLAYRRTTTVISRYNQALDLIVNHLDHNLTKTLLMNPLSKHLLLKELTLQADLIEGLVDKFNQNRLLMDQWKRSNLDFQKIVVRKSHSLNKKLDSFVVTEF